jgi:hypothetical protein
MACASLTVRQPDASGRLPTHRLCIGLVRKGQRLPLDHAYLYHAYLSVTSYLVC